MSAAADYRNLGPAGCIDTLQEQNAEVEGAPEPVSTLVDARGAVFSSEP
jgi:hypothetical protein